VKKDQLFLCEPLEYRFLKHQHLESETLVNQDSGTLFGSKNLLHFAKMSNKTGFYENPDFKKERQYCSFNKEEITNLIDGDQEQTKSRREFGKLNFKGCRLLYCV